MLARIQGSLGPEEEETSYYEEMGSTSSQDDDTLPSIYVDLNTPFTVQNEFRPHP